MLYTCCYLLYALSLSDRKNREEVCNGETKIPGLFA